ncbi:hypothetical protein [Nocardia wallacei]|uniref:hypothetical protein n=1 Tax=Nocardia wallacei TaxID=480035 RepID=UPI002454406E|nr:hypothetical protein [Nocardia wallacei]
MKRTDLVRRTALAVLATGAVGAATVVPAAAEAPAPAPPSAPAVSPLDVLPTPLNCLLTTGFAVFCLGVPLS